jgi:hypothetical protein
MAADQTTDSENRAGGNPNATGAVAKAVQQRTAGLFDANIDHYDSHNGISHIFPSKGQKGDDSGEKE